MNGNVSDILNEYFTCLRHNERIISLQNVNPEHPEEHSFNLKAKHLLMFEIYNVQCIQ